ncbi:MAG TPA: DUF881 domain-containing protein [Clostridiales bacterium]|nr:DUF881 domain-containing protein [Clostridiales bacterium]
MDKRFSGQLTVAFVCMILGLMLATQFKNVQKVGGNVSMQRTQELTGEVQRLKEENEKMKSQIQDYDQKIWEYENAAKGEGKLSQAIYDELDRMRMLAGVVDLEGPGVIVTVNTFLTNPQGQLISNVNYEDLLKLINELNAAGAEAIAINDERLIATTEIRNAGDYIVINTNRHSVPFEIKAIGNPDTLEAALKLLGGVADELSQVLDIKIKREDKIHIPKYEGTIEFNYAKPVEENK